VLIADRDFLGLASWHGYSHGGVSVAARATVSMAIAATAAP